MDDDIRARLIALEILVGQLIADRMRDIPEPDEVAAAALRALRPVIEDFPLDEPTLDAEARMRVRIEEAIEAVMEGVVPKLG